MILTFPRFSTLPPINENNKALINPLKRLALGSIFAGLIITINVIPLKTPVLSIPIVIKITALFLTIIGGLTALELALLTSKQFKITPFKTPYFFSSLLGYYPHILHQALPKISLFLGQNIANNILDQT